jgi:hypothetical protein
LIPSGLAISLSGRRVFSTADAKHDEEGVPSKVRPLRHLLIGAFLSPRLYSRRVARAIICGSAAAPGAPTRCAVARCRHQQPVAGGGARSMGIKQRAAGWAAERQLRSSLTEASGVAREFLARASWG